MKMFKYVMPNLGRITIDMHGDKNNPPVIRFFGFDPMGNMCLWAEVNDALGRVGRVIETIGTGHPIPDGHYIGTIRHADTFMWHAYDLGALDG